MLFKYDKIHFANFEAAIILATVPSFAKEQQCYSWEVVVTFINRVYQQD